MIDKRSALIARCQNVGDVITVVNFAHENDLGWHHLLLGDPHQEAL